MLKSKKRDFVTELESLYNQSGSVIITHYHGLTVAQLTTLRKSLRAKNGGFKIVKNTLSKIAVNQAGAEKLIDLFSGPTAIAYSEDPIGAAKSVVEFAKTNNKLKIIGGMVDDKLLTSLDVEQLAKIPSLDELRGQIVGLLQAPAAGIARILQAYADKN